jgi:hypothetical protein
MPSLRSKSLLALSLISSTTAVPTSSWWTPAVATSWQCVLDTDIGSLTLPVQIYDFDLFNTAQSDIDTLHAAGKQVMCYFSAGTYEPDRPDSSQILSDPSVVGDTVDGWPSEKWLDIRSDFIVNIMKARIDTAVSKNCDGVDPDNGEYQIPSFFYPSLDFSIFVLTTQKSTATITVAAASTSLLTIPSPS